MDEYNNAEICDRNNNDKKKPSGSGPWRRRGLFAAQTAGWLNCRPHTRFLKTTNLLLHQVGKVVTLLESNSVVIFFLFWIESAHWPLWVLILSATKPSKRLYKWNKQRYFRNKGFIWSWERLWLRWLFVSAKPKQTELAGGRWLRRSGLQLSGRTRPHVHMVEKEKKTTTFYQCTVYHRKEHSPHISANILLYLFRGQHRWFALLFTITICIVKAF